MADSFADLWKSTAPQKQTLSSLSSASRDSTSTAQQKPKYDAFSVLASSSASSSRSITPNVASKQKPIISGQKASNSDSFSGLFSGSTSSASSTDTQMTMAERARKAEEDRLDQQLQRQSSTTTSSVADTWLGLDSLGETSKPHQTFSPSTQDDWFTSVALPHQSEGKQHTTQVDTDDWDLGDFAPSTEPKPASNAHYQGSQGSIWDGDALIPATNRVETRPNSSPSAVFDFGEREDSSNAGVSDYEESDEIVGRRNGSSLPPASVGTRSRLQQNIKDTSSVTPPPHIIGQIVEMGFSPQQARNALAATETGLDVQAAIENLVSNDANSEGTSPGELPRSTRHCRQQGNGDSQSSAQRTPAFAPDASIQGQADKIFAQASEIGLNVFGKATAFWSASKEKVQKAYEERVVSPALKTNSPQQGRPSRPRWMSEQSSASALTAQSITRGPEEGIFMDESIGSSVSDMHTPTLKHSDPQLKSSPSIIEPTPILDLFSSDPMVTSSSVYVPKSRRGRRKTEERAVPDTSSVQSIPPPPSPPARPIVVASPSALSACQRHRTIGTEKFKLGQYADAAHAYSLAISSLPSGHLLLIPLHNNRALTRIKTGEYVGAIDDATTVINIIEPIFVPGHTSKINGSEAEGGRIDLVDSLLKAWKRRAEALEGKEKWAEAGKDWEKVAGAGWADFKARNEGVTGAARCRQMVRGEVPAAPQKLQSRRRIETSRLTSQHGPTPPSTALRSLRQANDAQEAEDNLRHELKDSVDARIVAWKGGKEANIRALISSLDTVLWPELGWETVGMKDLITEKQVKIKYTRAIGRLHPDKLNAHNTTLEHRMIANGVFGALNDAWNSFQHQ